MSTDNKKENLFGNSEEDTNTDDDTQGADSGVLDTAENDTEGSTVSTEKQDTGEVAKASPKAKPKRTRTASPATQLKVELKAAIRAKAMGSTGLEKLEAEKTALEGRLTDLTAKIEEARSIGSDEEMGKRINDLKTRLMDAIEAEVS